MVVVVVVAFVVVVIVVAAAATAAFGGSCQLTTALITISFAVMRRCYAQSIKKLLWQAT